MLDILYPRSTSLAALTLVVKVKSIVVLLINGIKDERERKGEGMLRIECSTG